jgi:heat shock protein HslJ
MWTSPVRPGLAFLLLVAMLTACGDDDVETSTAQAGDETSSAPSLEGTSWLLSPDAPLGVAIENIGVTAVFEDSTVSGQSGCNQYNGPYQVDGSSLTIGPDLATTTISCPPPQTAVETAFLARLVDVAAFEIDGDALIMLDDAGETILRFREVSGAEAIEGSWIVTSYYAVTAVTSVVGGVTLTADFGAETIAGETGCNSFNGPIRVEGTDIAIGPLASTLRACENEELSQQETYYLEALQLARSYSVAGDRLDLFREGGTYAVSFVAG